MLKIAICDDDLQELSRISNLLGQYRTGKNAALKYDVFSNAIELLEGMKQQDYDILLLDVFMPCINGIQVAREIREFNNTVKIIFLTSSPEFAVESYAVNAHYYLLKPGTADKLFPIIDKILLEINREEDALSIMLPSGLVRFPLRSIEFLEVYGKKLLFHLDDGSIKEIRGSLSEFEGQLLCRKEFTKVHRSYIVNMEYIQSLNAKELVTYTGQTVSVSRLLYSQVKEAYMQFLFVEKGLE